MDKWYENKTLLNFSILLMLISFISYFFYSWMWGLPLFLVFGTAIMVRGIIKITMRMRNNRITPESAKKEKK